MPKKTILIIEDDPGTMLWCATVLRNARYKVIEDGTGDSTLKDPPDCAAAIIDYILPKNNGLEIAERLSEKGIPFVMFTNIDDDTRLIRKITKLGGIYAIKQIDNPGVLVGYVETVIENDRLRKIAHARGIVQERGKKSKEEAQQWLLDRSNKSRQPLHEEAQRVIDEADSLF